MQSSASCLFPGGNETEIKVSPQSRSGRAPAFGQSVESSGAVGWQGVIYFPGGEQPCIRPVAAAGRWTEEVGQKLQGNKLRTNKRALNWLRWGAVLSLGLVGFTGGCREEAQRPSIPGRQPSAASPQDEVHGPIKVVATNAFLVDVVRSLGEDRVQVSFLIPTETDPTAWQPTEDDLVQMQAAQLLVLNGASFEPWVASVALPSSRMVRTANGFREQWIETEEVVHSHGPGGEHSHPATASTTWLDFNLARQQVAAVRNRLKQLLPAESDAIDQRAEAYLAELKRLDQEMERLAGLVGSRPLIVSHPVYQYWARRYGLNIRTVHWEPRVPPGAREWEELEQATQDFPATVFVWEAEPLPASQAELSKRGITSLIFCPAATLPPSGLAWREEMWRNLERLGELVK